MQNKLQFSQDPKSPEKVPESIKENIMLMKKPNQEIQMIYTRHNFFGYFIIDLIMFIDSDYKHLYLYQDLYNSIINNPDKTKDLLLKHLAFKEFDEPGIQFINNKIIEYHLDLLSKGI